VPTAFRTREIDFGDGPEHAVTIPWGDVVTAAHTTGIESIEVYAAAPSWATRGLSAVDSLGWLLERRRVEGLLKRLIDARLDGPPTNNNSQPAAPSSGARSPTLPRVGGRGPASERRIPTH